MENKSNFHGEKLFEFVILGLALVIIGISIDYGFGSLEQPGQGLYTFFVGAFILVFNTLNMISPEKKSPSRILLFANQGQMKKFIFLGIILIAWILAMPYLGYAPMTFIATFLIAKAIELEGWSKPFLLSMGTSLFIYLLFDYFLYIDLPRGILG